MNYTATREEFERYANELFELMAEKHFKTRIHETYPLKDVARAHSVCLYHDLLADDMTDNCNRISRDGRPWANCS